MAQIAFAAFLAAASARQQHVQGRKQERMQTEAMKRQEQAQAVARSATASERLRQDAEARQMRKRKPNTAAIMSKARQRRMAGETFLSNQQGMSMLDRTRYLG
tara:strand:+ start:1205 stop:1513 length:309 start_codon:yes stop_codon:yes gene_type:complete